MKKGLTLISVLLLAAAPSAVFAKSAKRVHHVSHVAAAPANPNANTAHMLGDGLHQIVVPLEKITGARQVATADVHAAPSQHKVRHARRHHRASKKKM